MMPVIYFEIPADDPKKLRSFYASVFGWRIKQVEGSEDYWSIEAKDGVGPGVNGGMLKKVGPNNVPINYMKVDSIDEHCAKVERAGGRVTYGKQPIPGMGWFAVAADPEGNHFGLFQEDITAPQRV